MYVVLLLIILVSFLIKNMDLVYWICYLILAQNIISILDFEGNRQTFNDSQNTIFVFKKFLTIVISQLCLNFIQYNMYVIFFITNVTSLLVSWGIIKILLPRNDVVSTNQVLSKIYSDPKYGFNLLDLFIHQIIGFSIMWYLLNSIQKEILKAWHQKSTM